MISNDGNMFRLASLDLSQDGVCTDSFENFSVKSFKRDHSKDIKFIPFLFFLVNTFKGLSQNGGLEDFGNKISAPLPSLKALRFIALSAISIMLDTGQYLHAAWKIL
jgi:hypothetical protein